MPNALQDISILNNIKRESVRCGEIYCHSPSEFTIHCELCELKSSDYKIFVLHFNLMHSDKNDEESISFVDENETNKVFTEDRNSEDSLAMETSQFAKSQMEEECLLNVGRNELGKDIAGIIEISENLKEKISCDQYSVNEETKISTAKKELKCEFCGKIYKSNTYLKNHIILEHDTNEESSSYPVKCTECSEEFPNKHLFNKHCMDEHNGIKCSYCNRKFKRRSDLMRHMDEKHTHCNDSKFVCDFENCSKRFYTKSNLVSHKSFHNKPKNFVCDVCGFSCQGGNMLRSHYKTHLDERPYECTVCNANFKRKNHLDRHVDIHYRDEKTFFCDFEECIKGFFTSRQLENHKRRHTMPKKYICGVCSYSTKHKQSLQIHYRKHTAEKSEYKLKV